MKMSVASNISAKQSVKTVFLDRDGVVNEKMPEGEYVKNWSDFRFLPGSLEAIRRLNQAGIRVVIVTNQRGISLGLYSMADLETIHAEFQSALRSAGARVDRIYVCPHPKGECDCRKPSPGLFEQARQEFPEITVASSVMIGDSFSDIEFGRQLGMRTVLISGRGSHLRLSDEKALELANMSCSTLSEAVEILLGDEQHAL
jgi:D-glycero-D-manno-heptose 1,7-bisphosphate phosphatase